MTSTGTASFAASAASGTRSARHHGQSSHGPGSRRRDEFCDCDEFCDRDEFRDFDAFRAEEFSESSAVRLSGSSHRLT